VEKRRKDEEKVRTSEAERMLFAELWIKLSMLFEGSFPVLRSEGRCASISDRRSRAGQVVTVPEDRSQSILRVASQSLCRAS